VCKALKLLLVVTSIDKAMKQKILICWLLEGRMNKGRISQCNRMRLFTISYTNETNIVTTYIVPVLRLWPGKAFDLSINAIWCRGQSIFSEFCPTSSEN
jgi:hypothetical protein